MRRPAVLFALAVAASVPLPGRAALTPPAPRHDLGPDEARGGHTLARHVGRTDDQLRERLHRERRLAAASTYTDRRTAEDVVGAALAAEADRVRRWTRGSGSRPNLVVDYRGLPGRPIGRSLRRGAEKAVPCFDAVVVLKWDAMSRDFHVLTSYPEVRR